MLHETFGNFAFAIACRVLGLRDIGPALSPFNAFLILTGIETLPLRMQRHCDNAQAVAEWLAGTHKVAWVSYPGLPGDRYHNLAKKYCPKGAGAVFTFGLKGGYDAGVKLVSNVKLFSHLANIGDTRSLIIHPASTTHRQLSDAQKVQAGAGPDVVRLSIGLEDKADIIARPRAGACSGVRRCPARHETLGGSARRGRARRLRRPHPVAIEGRRACPFRARPGPGLDGGGPQDGRGNLVLLSGRGEMWRKLGYDESVVPVEAGVCLTIPLGTHFQFRALGQEPLAALGVTMPPWPGEGEAYVVAGKWPPMVPRRS